MMNLIAIGKLDYFCLICKDLNFFESMNFFFSEIRVCDSYIKTRLIIGDIIYGVLKLSVKRDVFVVGVVLLPGKKN